MEKKVSEGGKGLRGERGKRISAGKGAGGKILVSKARRSGDKGLRGSGKDLREEREKTWGKI